MPRARNIKHSFFKNEQLVELPFATRLLFIGLWTIADRDGRLEDRPKRIRMEIFPADDVDVNIGLQELHDAGLILRYQAGAGLYIQVVNFAKHQHPHPREVPSNIPKPELGLTQAIPRSDLGNTEELPSPSDVLVALSSDVLNKNTVGQELPDADQLQAKKPKTKVNGSHPSVRSQALEVLDFLNRCTERNYQPVAVNLEMIEARLREGYTPLLIRRVISDRVNRWGADDKMNEYLRPATLFNRQKFSQYAGEIPPE